METTLQFPMRLHSRAQFPYPFFKHFPLCNVSNVLVVKRRDPGKERSSEEILIFCESDYANAILRVSPATAVKLMRKKTIE